MGHIYQSSDRDHRGGGAEEQSRSTVGKTSNWAARTHCVFGLYKKTPGTEVPGEFIQGGFTSERRKELLMGAILFFGPMPKDRGMLQCNINGMNILIAIVPC